MGATYSPRPELVFPDPFDTIRAAMPGAKLAAEADAIIQALQQILAAIREWKESQVGDIDAPGPAGADYPYLAENIRQLAIILGGGNFIVEEGGVDRQKQTMEERIKAARKMLERLRRDLGRAKNAGERARILAAIEGLEIFLGLRRPRKKFRGQKFVDF